MKRSIERSEAAAPLEIMVGEYQALDYDLALAIAGYVAELAAFAETTGEPAPAAPGLVERIVRENGGQFLIVADPALPQPLNELPIDAKYYRGGKAAMNAIAAKVAENKAIAAKQVKREAMLAATDE